MKQRSLVLNRLKLLQNNENIMERIFEKTDEEKNSILHQDAVQENL